jgi:hypothetical protein
MAYKFQVGSAILSGALTQEGSTSVESLDVNSGGITEAGAISGATTIAASSNATIEGIVSGAAGTFDALAGTSLALQAGGISAAGPITGATTIAASSNATIEGIVSGAAGTFDALAGTSLALQAGGISAAGTIAGASTVSGSGLFSMSAINNDGVLDNEGAANIVGKLTVTAVSDLDGGIDVNASQFTVSAAGAVVAESSVSGAAGTFDALAGTSLALQSGGISAAGAIAGASTIDASGIISGSAALKGLSLNINGNELISSAGNFQGNNASFNEITASSDVFLDGSTLRIPSVADVAFAAADSMLLYDVTDDKMKKILLSSYSTAIAGSGLAATAGVLSVDLNEATGGDVNVAADSFVFIDANGDVTRKDTYADYATAIAGAGLTATNGVLSVDGTGTPNSIGDANATLTESFNFGSATLTADRTWTLPASPTVGDVVRVKAPLDVGAFAVIVARGDAAHAIDGLAQVEIESDSGQISLIYAAANDWRLF